ncbi:MAG: HipA domain-containing protein, partial [Spirochaetales bacterium]|nr:HipA domain-containing protein [Spirochaetales bacterium]
MSRKEIFVYADWQGMAKPTLIGTLFVDIIRGREVFSFEYDDNWLSSHSYSFFDPDLSHYTGRQYLPNQKSLFGIFTDSCPDRWGRTLMKRREAIAAKEEARQVRTLLESDYLLGVDDFCRTGALRFKLNPKGAFLSDSDNPIPIWTDLRALEQSALFLDSDTQNTASEKKCLKMLLSPGSSLGGARPKATVSALDGSLWIAKFPSKKDSADVGAWEMVVHELALSAGLNVPSAKCEQFSKYGSTFLVKRFDRNNIGKRVHYISAMTVLGKSDGDSDSTSYLDIANAVRQYGVNVQTDLAELWSRIAFSIAVGN